MIGTHYQILFGRSDQEWDGWGMWLVLGREEIHTGYWWRNLKKREHLEDLDVDARKILKFIINK